MSKEEPLQNNDPSDPSELIWTEPWLKNQQRIEIMGLEGKQPMIRIMPRLNAGDKRWVGCRVT